MMGETFKYCAPVAGALGFSCKDTAQAIGLMANSGIKSTQAGTALRTIMNTLAGDVKICGDSIGERDLRLYLRSAERYLVCDFFYLGKHQGSY